MRLVGISGRPPIYNYFDIYRVYPKSTRLELRKMAVLQKYSIITNASEINTTCNNDEVPLNTNFISPHLGCALAIIERKKGEE